MCNSKVFTCSTSYTLRLMVGSISESSPGFSFPTWHSLSGQKCFWLYNLLQWEEELYLITHVESSLSAAHTYLITVRKKFDYDVGVDFIQIKVLIQPKKYRAVLLK